MSHWIARDQELRDLLTGAPDVFGLDTEFMRTDTFLPRLALVQVGVGERIGLVDPLAVTDATPLAALLADPRRLCVMHSASEDLEALATWSCTIVHLFDTQIAAAFAGLGAGLGYQALVRDLLGVELPKAHTRSDWLQRPLSPEQLEYAAQDVAHLPALHAGLAARLDQRGYAGWFAEDCARLLERARRREADPQPQLALRAAADWPPERQALLRRVLRWRDAGARTLNRPRAWLLDDARALDLSARPPATVEDLFERTRGLRALRGPQRIELLAVLNAPVAPDELDLPPIARAPDARDRRVIAAMKEVVAARAANLGLPEGLLCARRHLESLLSTHAWPPSLEGWRRPLLHDELIALLPD